jgi:hypothetical protein
MDSTSPWSPPSGDALHHRTHRIGEGIGDLRGFFAHPSTEEGATHDGHGQRRHLVGHVDTPARSPALQLLNRLLHHEIAVGRDTSWDEGGRQQLAMPLMDLPLGREEPGAEQGLKIDRELAGLLEGLLLVDQQLMDDRRIRHDMHRNMEHAESRHGTQGARGLEEADQVAAKGRQASEQRLAGHLGNPRWDDVGTRAEEAVAPRCGCLIVRGPEPGGGRGEGGVR